MPRSNFAINFKCRIAAHTLKSHSPFTQCEYLFLNFLLHVLFYCAPLCWHNQTQAMKAKKIFATFPQNHLIWYEKGFTAIVSGVYLFYTIFFFAYISEFGVVFRDSVEWHKPCETSPSIALAQKRGDRGGSWCMFYERMMGLCVMYSPCISTYSHTLHLNTYWVEGGGKMEYGSQEEVLRYAVWMGRRCEC